MLNLKSCNLFVTVALCLLIILLSIMVRLYSCDIVESGGDAFSKWAIIRNYVENNTAPTVEEFRTHHVMRWAINVPVLMIQNFCGTHPNMYYIWPMSISTIGAIFCFFIGRNMYGVFWGLIISVIFIFAEPFRRQGSQFLPMGPATVYLLGAILFFQLWVDKKKFQYLFFCAVFWFLSYGAKVTGIYYIPAFLILFYYFSENPGTVSKFKPAVIFFFVLCCLILCETVVTHMFTENPGGRLGSLGGGGHVVGAYGSRDPYIGDWRRQSDTLLQYFYNIFFYAKDTPSHKIIILYYYALLLSIKVLVVKQKKFYVFSLLYLSAFFIPAYAVVRIFPFVRPERMLGRYQTFLHILALLLVTLDCIEYIKKRNILKQKIEYYIDKLRINKAISRIFDYRLILLGYTIVIFLWLTRPVMDIKNGWFITQTTFQIVKEARENNRPILVKSDPDAYEKMRNVWRYQAVYGDPAKGTLAVFNFRKPVFVFEEKIVNGEEYLLVENGLNTPYLLLDKY